jgi:diacylglycerol kinase family enzyme
MLGMPDDVVDATEHLLRIADAWQPRAVDLARVNDRWYTFSAGIGLDASVVKRVDAHPELKARLRWWFYTEAAVSTFLRRYIVNPPRLSVRAGDQMFEGVSAMVQNAFPYTYFERRPVNLAKGATLDSGNLAGVVLTRANPLDVPTVAWRALSQSARMERHRRVKSFSAVSEVVARSVDGRPIPIQVDGDHICDEVEARFTIAPGHLQVVC